MQESRIADLLDPFLGPKDQRPNIHSLLKNISTYIDMLQRWNARVNLTAIRDENEIVTRHFGESLFAARHLFPPRVTTFEPSDLGEHAATANRGRAALEGCVNAQQEQRALAPEGVLSRSPQTSASSAVKALEVADVGSGAGFPGIPIKLWASEISLTLIESNHKKATFLREVARALTLTDVDIQNARAESLAGASFDIVTLRAVERFESILPIAASLLSKKGRLALLIGKAQLGQAQSTLSVLGWTSPIPIPNSQSRLLAVATRA